MANPSMRDRLRYRFDNLMGRGTGVLIGALALTLGVVIVLISSFVYFTGRGSQESFGEQLWEFLILTLNPDVLNFDHVNFRVATLAIICTSIFVLSTLIGVISAGIDGRLALMRKGRSKVIESGHTVILGWSGQIFSIISELIIANENQPNSCIVILGDRDKVEMEDEIRDQIGSTGRTRVVCRSGDPMDIADLPITSLPTSKSIIILASNDEHADSTVIKTMLAVTKSVDRREAPYHIVAEIQAESNLEVARIVAGNEAELISTWDLVARIIAQSSRQSGLSFVYTELMDFAGDEIYFSEEPGLIGKTYADSLLLYEDSAVIGLHPLGGQPILNPPMETLIESGDMVIAISEDDDTVLPNGKGKLEVREDVIRDHPFDDAAPENILILGWNSRAPSIINELDHYVSAGSSTCVVSPYAKAEDELRQKCGQLVNQRYKFHLGDIADREILESFLNEEYDHVVVLSLEKELGTQKADAQTLITLLHLRDIAEKAGSEFSIVSEMADVRNRRLAEAARADDFVVSDRVISLLLSQISENKALGPVFADLFDPTDSEIWMKSVGDYVELGTDVNFYTVVDAGRRRGQTAIGYRIDALSHRPDASYGVVLNPHKGEQIRFLEEDCVIILSEN